MNCRKLILALTVLLSLIIIFGKTEEVFAADRGDRPRSGQIMEGEEFGGISDTTEYIEMPDGGYLHGEAVETSIDNGVTYQKKYSSSNSSNTITLKEIKKKLKNENFEDKEKIKIHGTKPASTVYNLSYKDNYISNNFSGSSWSFAGYLFKAVNSSGSDLIWESHNDNAVIGSKQQAWNTLDSGYAEGYLINSNAYLYLSGTKTYYNHNPQNGAYYYVGNVD